MPIHTAFWKVGATPERLVESALAKEQLLEDMIVADPRLLSDEWLLIGRQEDTGYGGRIDLLALAPDGALILIELKRDRTPREVVAQALDYASWVEQLQPDEVAAIYGRFAPGKQLNEDFQLRFGQELDEEMVNSSHQIIIVASSLDASSERIVAYLSKRDIPINVLCFQVFSHGADQLLCRSWLLDPIHTQVNASLTPDGPVEPWNGEFYGSFGQDDSKADTDDSRSWQDAVEFGFFSAGGGAWYSRTLQLLKPGDRIWVKVPQRGFVGVGRVTGLAQPAASFSVQTDKGVVPILAAPTRGKYHSDWASDLELCEYFVPVRWLETVPVEQAVQEIGMFGNQNSVCKPTAPKWRSTVERLKQRFPKHASDVTSTGTL